VNLTVNGHSGAAVDLGSLSIAGVETLNLTATTGTTLDSLSNAGAVTNINVVGAGDVHISTGSVALNVNTIIDAHAATGAVTIDASGSTAYGIKIIGSTTGDNILISNDSNSVLVGGSGNDTLHGGAGDDTITAGDGVNQIDGGAGADTIVAGNGYNQILNEATTGTVHVTVGSGSNIISLMQDGVTGVNDDVANTAVYNITLGAHNAAVGADYILVGTAGAAFSVLTPTTVNYVIKGAVAGDDITFQADQGHTTFAAPTVVTNTGTLTQALVALEAAVATGGAAGANAIAYVVSHGNTYVAESINGGATGADTTVIELVGVHTVTASATAGHIIVG